MQTDDIVTELKQLWVREIMLLDEMVEINVR